VLVLHPGVVDKVPPANNRQVVSFLGLVIMIFSVLTIILSRPSLTLSNPLRIFETVACQGKPEDETRRISLRDSYNLDRVCGTDIYNGFH
jgi:hypothetical protein